ncbi:MAG TPA: iron-sulfur cluster assembly accessory protein [Nitrososphaerales archaeon]|nr:iron-sulfur cluster assembly accessory protein [Nitrososphaerales archaeon]
MQSSTQKIVSLTPLAIDRVKEFMAKDKDQSNGLRIFVAQGGCSGYQYGMVLERSAKNDDISWSENGINVYIDNQSAKLMEGAEIDFVETVQGSGFKISNPNAVSSCGCGNSFETSEGGHSHSEGEAEEEGCGCGCGGH